MSKKYTFALVPETHWDREWYSPFQEFRIRLVRLTDKLLDILDKDPAYVSFTFDGQTVVIEDYLEIRPQERARIEKLVKNERLFIGPWYILPDEFLVSAEATVRNLMIGHMIGEEFGRTMKAGYIPDPFGHLSQLPQILDGFGIPSAYFMRGVGDEGEDLGTEFWWEAPDGTKVLAIHLIQSYCNAMHLGYKREDGKFVVDMQVAMDQVKAQFDALAPRANTRYLILNNGCDHVEPQPELPEIIKHINEHFKDADVVHTNYEDVSKMILETKPKLKTFRGEFHRGKYQPLLPGVFSTRMYIKQANERTQTLLEKWAEPASAFAWLVGGRCEQQLLWHAWKTLIKNHPHDSICGCSVDQVHREMMPRFDQAQQIGDVLTRESLAHIADKVDTSLKSAGENTQAVVVFNPHAWGVTDTVKLHMDKELAAGEMAPSYVVKDASGRIVPTHITNDFIMRRDRRRAKWSADVYFTGSDVPSLGYKTYYVEPGEPKLSTSLSAGLGVLENGFVKVLVRSNGTFDLYHKASRTTYQNMNLLDDTEDVGDEYNYGAAYNSRTITTEGAGGTLSTLERGPGIATLRADFVMRLPESVTDDRMSRSERTIDCPVVVYETLHADHPRVDVVTVFENKAKDHRLRAQFPLGFTADSSFAEGQFDVVQRPIEIPSGEGWFEKPMGQKPVQSYVAVDGTDCGLAVINQGLPEYEVTNDDPQAVAQTLLRCVGWISRDDYKDRPVNAGPTIYTPEAQCLGKHVFSYAVLPYQGNWKRALVWRQAHQHNAPLRTQLTSIHKGELPKEQSFVHVEPANIIVTAVKKAEKGDALIVRVLNTTPDKVEARITLNRKYKKASLVNLNEEPCDRKAASTDGKVKFDMPGFRVQTVKFEL
jgi:mannosylglycerate hydrolase